VFQYHAVNVERFMVSVIAHMPRQLLHPQLRRSLLVPGIRWSVTLPQQTLGDVIMCVQQESSNLQPFPLRSSAEKNNQRCFTGSMCW
jgi:hypothetical protein